MILLSSDIYTTSFIFTVYFNQWLFTDQSTKTAPMFTLFFLKRGVKITVDLNVFILL